jgi:ankyrin repeat protein
MFDLLLSKGVDINSGATGVDVNGSNKAGWTPLMYATGDGNFKNVPYLLRHGADPFVRDNHGATALELAQSWAATKDQRTAVRLLTEVAAARRSHQ